MSNSFQPCGYPFPSPGDHPNPRIKCRSPTLQADSLPAEPQGKPKNTGVVAYPFSRGLSQPRNQGLLHCRLKLCQLNYQGSPLIPGKAYNSKICRSDYVKRSEQKYILKGAAKCQRITMIMFFIIWYTKAL